MFVFDMVVVVVVISVVGVGFIVVVDMLEHGTIDALSRLRQVLPR